MIEMASKRRTPPEILKDAGVKSTSDVVRRFGIDCWMPHQGKCEPCHYRATGQNYCCVLRAAEYGGAAGYQCPLNASKVCDECDTPCWAIQQLEGSI